MARLGEDSLLDQWRNRSSSKNVPLQASLELTFKCNERCSHCYIEEFRDDPNRVLSADQWTKVLEELRAAGTLYITLMGGEAMLNPHFWHILDTGSKMGFQVIMITNGLLIRSQEVADRLRDSGLTHITFSYYSMRPEIHDRMTKVKGAHAKITQAMKFVTNSGIQFGINSLLSKENIAHYFELEDWCLENNIRIRTDPTITPKYNGDLAPTKLRPTREQLKWYMRETAKRYRRGIPVPNGMRAEDFTCNVGKGKCAVTPYGELLTCIEVREPLGSLLDSSFAELWKSPTAEKWRNIRNQDLEGLPTDSTVEFCEHCPGMSDHEVGNPLQVTDYFRLLAEVREEVRSEFI